MNGITTSEQCKQEVRNVSRLDKIGKHIVLGLLKRIQYGQIILHDGDIVEQYGNDDSLRVKLTIHSQRAYRKVLLCGSIGAGEAYIDKLWDVDDLTKLIRIMVLNLRLVDKMEQGFALIMRPVYLIGHMLNRNSRRGARRNILAHYDLGNDMYKSFLDPTMMYSSAIYPGEKSGLEEASRYKLQLICEKLDLQPTDQVVEIGSGWGGFAIFAAKNYGCHITTTTISDAQYEEARARVNRERLEDKITLLKSDYRDLTGRFDKLVSIEMIEAVGHRFLPDFFRKCSNLLKDNGIMLLQAITITDQTYKNYVRSVDFIQRHIFPGGCVPSNNHLFELISKKTDMVVRRLDDFGFDYARTLRDWRKRFNKNFDSLRSSGYDDTFKRLWEFYFCYCEGGFLERSISVIHLVASKPGNRRNFQ